MLLSMRSHRDKRITTAMVAFNDNLSRYVDTIRYVMVSSYVGRYSAVMLKCCPSDVHTFGINLNIARPMSEHEFMQTRSTFWPTSIRDDG